MAVQSARECVAVIIPMYNGERYLAETLDSVRRQTYSDWECILVDDGSTDGTLALARRFAEDDARITVVAQPNAGVSAARNRGIATVSPTVTLLAFIDNDDTWLPDALEHLVGALVGDPAAVGAYGLAEYIDENGHPVNPGAHPAGQRDRRMMGRFDLTSVPVGDPATFSSLLVSGTIWPPAVAVHRRSAVEAVGGFDVGLGGTEDWDLYLRMSRLGPFRIVDRQVAWYRRHGSNVSGDESLMIAQVAAVRWRAWTSERNTPAQRREVRRVHRRLAARWTMWTAAAGGAALRRGRPAEAGRAACAAAYFAVSLARGRPVKPSERMIRLMARYVVRRAQGAAEQLP